jgi:uncharacterized protein
LSLGKTDAAVVVSSDVPLADAAATALGNAVTRRDSKNIQTALESIFSEDIEGMLVAAGGLFGFLGSLPEFIKANVDYSLISAGPA